MSRTLESIRAEMSRKGFNRKVDEKSVGSVSTRIDERAFQRSYAASNSAI